MQRLNRVHLGFKLLSERGNTGGHTNLIRNSIPNTGRINNKATSLTHFIVILTFLIFDSLCIHTTYSGLTF